MAPTRLLALLLLFLVGAAAESIRETEVIDPQDLLEGRYFSGALPDDEDAGVPGQEPGDFELSGSGDLDDVEEPKIVPEVVQSSVPLDNRIPEDAGPGSQLPTKPKELPENEVVPKKISPFEGDDDDMSNRVSMSSTAQSSSIFERTEILAALIVGGIVGILFAVFLILLLLYRVKKKDEGTYDLGKKPIYKKAPTTEFYA